MKRFYCLIALLLALVMLAGCTPTTPNNPDTPDDPNTPDDPADQKTITIDEDVLKDKIAGSWVGQMAGVTWGAPTEFRFQSRIIPENQVPEWKPSMVNNAFTQDDLYVEIPFMDAMKNHGVDCSLDVFGRYFAETKFGLAHANLIGRKNLRDGVAAAEAGHYRNNYHADDIDWQIEADFLGNMYPGMVNRAAARAFELGHLMNYGDGVLGGVYITAMHSAAMTTQDLREVLDAGIAVLPEGTKFREVIEDVEASYENGDTWEECWQIIEKKWGRDDKCPECTGSMNIDAKINAAYIHMGLLWGEGDFEKTMLIAMRGGQDSDCNPSSAAAILGTLYGLSGLPEKFVGEVNYNGKKFSFTDYTLQDCLDDSLRLAEEVMKKEGGTKEGKTWTLRVDKELRAVPFEQWPDDEICVYLNVEARAQGKVAIDCRFVLPEGVKQGEQEISLDLGDGTVIPGVVPTYTYRESGTYTITCTAKANGKTATTRCTVTLDFDPQGRGFHVVPSCSEDKPTGGGSKDIAVIADGVVPANQENIKLQYDTCTGKRQEEAWFALKFDHKVTVTAVLFSEGAHFGNGGWFRKTPTIQVYKDSKWVDTETTISPLYMEVDDMAAQGDPMQTFTFELVTPEKCEGVRVIGVPGGSATFVSCSELDVRFSEVENPTYDVVDEDDCVSTAIPYVSETAPSGGGSKNIEVMRDGIVPKAGDNHSNVQYDTFRGREDDHEDFFGYIFRGTWTVSRVIYTSGNTFGNGGWFKDGSIRLEALIDGEWQTVKARISPSYPNGNAQANFRAYKTYTFMLDLPTDCAGIRVIGMAGGSSHFVSVSELDVEAVRKP